MEKKYRKNRSLMKKSSALTKNASHEHLANKERSKPSDMEGFFDPCFGMEIRERMGR